MSKPRTNPVCLLLLISLLTLTACNDDEVASKENAGSKSATVAYKSRQSGKSNQRARHAEPTQKQINELIVEGLKPDEVQQLPFTGVRIWFVQDKMLQVEELSPGRKPNQFAKHPIDPNWTHHGQQFKLPDHVKSDNQWAHVRRLVGSADWAWVISGEKRLMRADCAADKFNVDLKADDYGPRAKFTTICGDDNALYVAIEHPEGDDGHHGALILELDPVTGVERKRIMLESSKGGKPVSMRMNEKYLAVARSSRKQSGVSVIDRGTFQPTGFANSRGGINPVALTDGELWVAKRAGKTKVPHTLSRFSLPDCTELESGKEMPSNGDIQVFGGDVVMCHNSAYKPIHALNGNLGEQLVQMLGKEKISVSDVLIHEGYAILQSGQVEEGRRKKANIWVMDLATGNEVMATYQKMGNGNVSIVKPAVKTTVAR